VSNAFDVREANEADLPELMACYGEPHPDDVAVEAPAAAAIWEPLPRATAGISPERLSTPLDARRFH
jgi:hypothetical protein